MSKAKKFSSFLKSFSTALNRIGDGRYDSFSKTGRPYQGNAADSSEAGDIAQEYIERAMWKFCKENKIEVFQLAYKMMQQEVKKGGFKYE